MISAWHSSQHLKLGLFSDAEADWCPLAPDEVSKNAMRPFKPENIETHDLWIRFIQERIDIAKYCSQEQIYMFSHMLQRTLDISIGRKRQGRHGNRDKVLPTMSRHITTVGKIFKGHFKPNQMSQWIILDAIKHFLLNLASTLLLSLTLLEFIYSEKAKKFCKIFTLLLTGTT